MSGILKSAGNVPADFYANLSHETLRPIYSQ